MSVRASIYGKGQLGTGVAEQLSRRPDVQVAGPWGRSEREAALTSGADIVVIATTTLLRDVLSDVAISVEHGSNVIVSAEEAAFPWAVDLDLACTVDMLAKRHGVTIFGGGVNPGFVFDALVLSLLGPGAFPTTITVSRVVNLSAFGPVVRRRLGLDYAPEEFAVGVTDGRILGHAGFPQSIAIVADALGVELSSIDKHLEPLITTADLDLGDYRIVAGRSAGVGQVYVGRVDGQPWYEARFVGHVAPDGVGLTSRDVITIDAPTGLVRCELEPGIKAQAGSASMIANSVDRVLAAPAGWLTVSQLPPARPPKLTQNDRDL